MGTRTHPSPSRRPPPCCPRCPPSSLSWPKEPSTSKPRLPTEPETSSDASSLPSTPTSSCKRLPHRNCLCARIASPRSLDLNISAISLECFFHSFLSFLSLFPFFPSSSSTG